MPTRRGATAATPELARGAVRWRLLDRYARDPAFGHELEAVFAAQLVRDTELPDWWQLASELAFDEARPADWPGEPLDAAVVRYVRAVRDLVRAWGLERLMGPHEEQAAWLVHDWCQHRRLRGPVHRPGVFAHELGVSGSWADIGEVVAREEWDVGPVRVVEEHVRPIVRIAITDAWDPRTEPRAAARRRLRALADRAIRAELDRLTEDAEAKGYDFIDTAPALERDLDWLFAMLTGRATPAELAAAASRDPIDQEAGVAKAIRRVAARAGISVRGWRLLRE